MLGIAAVNRASGLEALDLLLRYTRWLAPGWNLEVDASRGVLMLRETIPRADLLVFATEWFTVGLYTVAVTMLGKPPVTEVRLSDPEPPHSALYERFIAVPVRFGCPATEADLDMALLNQPFRLADPAMAKLAEQYVASEAGAAPAGGVLEQIRQVLKANARGWPDLDGMARILQTSGRSLRRELKRLNTTYRELLDAIRLERAEQLVRHTDITLERISEQLGFSDVRSFRRAFKRWTGRTPAELRDEP
jgi:AraC-like DNA-binding protein